MRDRENTALYALAGAVIGMVVFIALWGHALSQRDKANRKLASVESTLVWHQQKADMEEERHQEELTKARGLCEWADADGIAHFKLNGQEIFFTVRQEEEGS